MSFANPTQLQIGMHGNFAGRDFRILGRIVMGMQMSGETYYWNEFHLHAETGEEATLVFEDSESGGDWRLFRMFDPEYPLTAADAATKEVGDRLNLTGTDVRVTLVSASRVYQIEGVPPEGLKIGDRASYFNAEAGDVMQVVSWTGDEVEYYNGFTLARSTVEAAFNVRQLTRPRVVSQFGGSASVDDDDAQNYLSFRNFCLVVGVFVAVFFIFLVLANVTSSGGGAAAPVKRVYAGPPPLVVGAIGQWQGMDYRITAHAVTEIGEVGTIYERNEYELSDAMGPAAVLVCGLSPGATNWVWLSPLTPATPPTPQQCAKAGAGDLVNIDGETGRVKELFHYSVQHMENVATSHWQQGEVQYGYLALADNVPMLVQWNADTVHFYRGQIFSSNQANAFYSAFGGSNSR